MKILITGIPGSGKTTVGKKLAEDIGYCFVGTGALLRQLALEDSDLGRRTKQELDSGELVNDETVALVVKDRLSHQECRENFIMDGYPRSLSQLHRFDPGFDRVFYLRVSGEVARERLGLRGRSDDSPEVVEHRLKIHEENASSVLEYYKANSEVVEINGEDSVENVCNQIRGHLV